MTLVALLETKPSLSMADCKLLAAMATAASAISYGPGFCRMMEKEHEKAGHVELARAYATAFGD